MHAHLKVRPLERGFIYILITLTILLGLKKTGHLIGGSHLMGGCLIGGSHLMGGCLIGGSHLMGGHIIGGSHLPGNGWPL